MSYVADRIPVYTSAGPAVPTSDELRARIHGWGIDLDPKDRPAYPRESAMATGAHWDLPEAQEPEGPRERSIEHQRLPPVFGTSVPLRGLSGTMRRYAYSQFSEARAAHWLLLLASDRVDAIESHLASLLTARPDNPLTQTGLRGEFRRTEAGGPHGRVDGNHRWLDPLVVAGPWVVAAGVAALGVRALVRRLA